MTLAIAIVSAVAGLLVGRAVGYDAGNRSTRRFYAGVHRRRQARHAAQLHRARREAYAEAERDIGAHVLMRTAGGRVTAYGASKAGEN